MLPFAEQLHALLSAPYPLLTLCTHEEARALGLLTQLTRAMGRELRLWRPEDAPGDPAASLDLALDELAAAEAGSALLVCVDAHPWLGEPARVRRLRVLVAHLMASHGQVIFLTPVAQVPAELARDWDVVEMPLPERRELEQSLARVVAGAEVEVDRERVSSAALGLTGAEALRAFERARHEAFLASARGETLDWESAVIREKRRLLQQGTALEFVDTDIGIDAVGGLEDLKAWLGERRRAFGDEAKRFGLPAPRGALLTGVQGCGKSLAAKAVAGFWGIPLLRLDLGALFSGHLAPDPMLRNALRAAEAMSPSVLWVDEIEKGFEESGAEGSRLMGALLTWLQEKRSAVFFVATANRVQGLPPELLRRGRFDEVFFVDLPDRAAREAIVGIHLRGRGRDPAGFDLSELSRITEHFSGAELEQVVVAALYAAFGAGRELESSDLVVAARLTVPLYAMYETEIKALRAWSQGRARRAAPDRKLVDLFGSGGRQQGGN